LTVGDNQTYWFNVSLFPIPETILLCGYTTDNTSGEPLGDTYIGVYWSDTQGHSWVNTTISNSSGYYSVGSYMGTNQIHVDHDGYFTYSTMIDAENISMIWLNVSLVPYPPVSAFVCGYIIDADLGIPVTDAEVQLFCDTGYGAFYNTTSSDARGFYHLGTITGLINLFVTKSEYSPLWEQYENITENETLWINLTMTFNPSMTSMVQGYVVDSQTHAAVRNAFVRLDWTDHLGHSYTNKGFTDQTGFYQIAAPKGTVQLSFSAMGYSSQQTALWGLRDSSDLWINTSLSPEITLVFDKPQPGVYMNNTVRFPALTKILSRFFPNSKPLIIGPIEIVVNITKSTQGCNRVAFYIDGVYRGVDTVAPFTYYWNDTGGLRHVLRVVAYDNAGPCRIETRTVWKIR
jgi:Bacterial Ig domain